MIQAVHKGVEIEIELHQLQQDFWRCDFSIIKHSGGQRTVTLYHAKGEFPSMDLAEQSALQEARQIIDSAS
jgi:hypothetical protein